MPVSASALVIALTLGAPGAVTAQQASSGPDQEPLEEIMVTGSRIRRTGMVTPTPVTAMDIEEMHRHTPAGASMVDMFDALPQFMSNINHSSGVTSNIPATSGPNVDMRSLGRNRTLVLMNGRRLVPASKEGAPDIDMVPQAALQGVDIVTGGASAAYGTDAVAGVVNFLLDTEFTGIRGNVQGGISARGDNQNSAFDMTYGTPVGENGHLILSAMVAGERGIQSSSSRSWTGLGTMLNPEWVATGQGPQRVHAREIVPRNWTCGGLINAPGSSIHRLEFNPDGTATPFVDSAFVGGNEQSLATEFGGGSGLCDPRFQDPDTAAPNFTNDLSRKTLFGYFDYEVTDGLKLFTQVNFGRRLMTSHGATNAIRAPWNATIFVENAFLPEDIRQAMIDEGRESFQFNRLGNDLITHAYNKMKNKNVGLMAGFEFDSRAGWHVTGHYQFGENEQDYRPLGHLRQQTLHLAIDAVRHPETGEIVCHSALVNPELFADCVPINLFGEGRRSEAARRYVTVPTVGDANQIIHLFTTDLHNAEVVASGPVFDGWGPGAVSAAVGASYRKESITSEIDGLPRLQRLDPASPTNDIPGVRGVPAPIAGDFDIQQFSSFAFAAGGFEVWELFAEAFIPIVEGVTGSLGVRWADYEGSGAVWAYKGGLDWQATDQLRLRGTYSRDVRAATLGERFDISRAGSTIDDPQAGVFGWLFSQTLGGNPEVNPEKADTLTLGVVYQPEWAPGFSVSADWWQIDIDGAIGLLGTQRIVNDCFETGAPIVCDLITRNAEGFITDVFNVFININREQASGLDLEFTYGRDFELFGGGPESFDVRFLGSWLNERSETLPGVPKRDTVGEIPRGGDFRSPARPEYTFTLNLTYANGPWSVSLQERYIHSGVLNIDWESGVDVDDNRVPATWYTNLRVGYRHEVRDGRWDFYAHAINLFDQAPPHRGGSHAFDRKGQRFVAGARFAF